MPRRIVLRRSDLRGAARLAVDATTGVTDLVEAVHARIASLPGAKATSERTGGISGLVYRSVRGVTRLVGGGIDRVFGELAPDHPGAPVGPKREAIVAALNGVLGDHLAATGNPLATSMALRQDGRALVLDRAALAERLPDPGRSLLVLAHGLCMNDLQWQRDGHDHGAMLARELGFTPLYLHYNSGLHIAANGAALAGQLERLVEQWPQPVQRLVLLGHSMGGLVMRSALHHATHNGQRWPAPLSDMLFLGTPHHGAPLERAGSWVDLLLGAAPYAAPFARLGRLRSAGITDLRHGTLLDAATPVHVPLPARVRCFALAADLDPPGGGLKGRLLGDGLVPVASALGQHRDRVRRLAFAADRRAVVHGANHMELLSHPAVAAQLQHWLRR